MTVRIVFGSIAMMCVLAFPAHADGKRELQKYFSDTATEVKETGNPAEKREILNESLHTMSKALDVLRSSPGISQEDRVGIDRLKATVQEKLNELEGSNGFVRVPDNQLNAFSDYVVQDMEQADQMITISLVTLLLIIILVILIL